MVPSRFRANLMVVAALATVYFVAGKLSLLLAFVNASATTVWPPTGIALAACLVLGSRVWPGIFLGAFFVNLLTVGSIATTLGITLGNTLEALAGAYLVNRFAKGCQAFDRAKDVFKFAGLAGLVSTTIGATFGVTSLSLGGYADWANYGAIWLTWWLGDLGGDLLLAPLLILWSTNPQVRWNLRQGQEIALLFLTLALVSQAAFGGGLLITIRYYPHPLAFLCVPILVWAAVRFGPRETATANILVAGIAIWGTLHGFGPFVRETPTESLHLLQEFMGIITMMAMALAAAVWERERLLQDALDHVKTLLGLMPICAACKKIRNDEGFWEQIELYLQKHSDAVFTHGLCPECMEQLYGEKVKTGHKKRFLTSV